MKWRKIPSIFSAKKKLWNFSIPTPLAATGKLFYLSGSPTLYSPALSTRSTLREIGLWQMFAGCHENFPCAKCYEDERKKSTLRNWKLPAIPPIFPPFHFFPTTISLSVLAACEILGSFNADWGTKKKAKKERSCENTFSLSRLSSFRSKVRGVRKEVSKFKLSNLLKHKHNRIIKLKQENLFARKSRARSSCYSTKRWRCMSWGVGGFWALSQLIRSIQRLTYHHEHSRTWRHECLFYQHHKSEMRRW